MRSILLPKYACLKKDYLLVDNYTDRRVCFRIFLCICVFVMCILVLLHLISNQDPFAVKTSKTNLSENVSSYPWFNEHKSATEERLFNSRPALHGLGTTFVRGSMAMDELVVAHVAENTSMQEFRLFLRTFFRSGLAARADMVLLFTFDVLPVSMEDTIHQEVAYLCKLLSQERQNSTLKYDDRISMFSAFNSSNYVKPMSSSASFWGHESNQSDQISELDKSMVKFSLSSIVGFSVVDLNPENTFQGFIDKPPLEVQRWACYELLLGIVKHKYKQVLLTGVRGVLILGDPLVTARMEMGLYLSLEDVTWGSSSKLVGDVGEDELRSFEEMGKFNYSDLGGSNGAKHGHFHDEAIASHAPMIDSYVQKVLLAWKPSNAHQRRELASYNTQENVENELVKDIESSSAHEKSVKQNGRTIRLSNILKKGPLHKKVRKMRRRQKARGWGGGGLYERVYGRMMWSMLEDAEKKKRLVNSAAIMGTIQHVQELANTMVVEIVRVAGMHRRSREAFPDNVLLSHLVHKSGAGKKVGEGHLRLLENSESFVHSVVGSQQPSVFFKGESRLHYSMISEGNSLKTSRLWKTVVELVHRDICLSSMDVDVYCDCLH